jgi:hypothetical protein
MGIAALFILIGLVTMSSFLRPRPEWPQQEFKPEWSQPLHHPTTLEPPGSEP